MKKISVYDIALPAAHHYLTQIEHLISKSSAANLRYQHAPGAFECGTHLAVAIGYALRMCFPLAGLDAPKPPENDLAAALQFAREQLASLTPEMFENAAEIPVTHKTGFSEHTQPGLEYLTIYALPNFIFHIATAHAALRAQGVDVGKADFDGLHDYPKGFHF